MRCPSDKRCNMRNCPILIPNEKYINHPTLSKDKIGEIWKAISSPCSQKKIERLGTRKTPVLVCYIDPATAR